MTKKRQPSKTPHIKSWPADRERGTDHAKGYINEQHWLTKFVRAFFRNPATPDAIPSKADWEYEVDLANRKHFDTILHLSKRHAENIQDAQRDHHEKLMDIKERQNKAEYPVPSKPDPRITPQTSKGNYPKKDKE